MPRSQHLGAVLAIVALTLFAPAAKADITVFLGHTSIDRSGFGSVTTAGLRANILRVPAGVVGFSLDAEGSTTIDKGSAPDGREWDYRSGGLYATARTAGPLYLLGRVGVARNRFAVDNDSTTETQTGAGIGIGASLRVLRFEVTANRFGSSGDIDRVTWITAGVTF